MFFNLHTLLLRMWPTDEGKKQDIHEAHQWFWVSFSTRSLRLSSQETTTVNMTWTDTRIATMLDCSEVMSECESKTPDLCCPGLCGQMAADGYDKGMMTHRGRNPQGPKLFGIISRGGGWRDEYGRWTASLVTDRALSNLNLLLLHDCKTFTTSNFELWTTLRHWELTSSRSLVAGIFGIAWIFLMFDVTNLFLPARFNRPAWSGYHGQERIKADGFSSSSNISQRSSQNGSPLPLSHHHLSGHRLLSSEGNCPGCAPGDALQDRVHHNVQDWVRDILRDWVQQLRGRLRVPLHCVPWSGQKSRKVKMPKFVRPTIELIGSLLDHH